MLLMVVIMALRAVFAVTVGDAYRGALTQTESVSIARVRAEQAGERFFQARAGVLPQLSFSMSYLRQEAPANELGFLAADQSASRITLNQPLFRGGSEYAALRMARVQQRAAAAREISARIELYCLVVESFYWALTIEQEQKNIQLALELARTRTLDIERRVRAGRAKRADLLSGQSQQAALGAQVEAVGSQLREARIDLGHLTGLNAATRLEDAPDPGAIGPLNEYETLLERRADFEALRLELLAVEQERLLERGQHLPSVDLTGNYYLKRNGALANSRWDLGVFVTLPIFSGGGTASRVREASLKYQEKELLYAEVIKEQRKLLHTRYESLTSGRRQLILLRNGLDLARQNYEEAQRDYRFGQVTNLEVISALNGYYETQRDLDRLRFQNAKQYALLEAMIGKLP